MSEVDSRINERQALITGTGPMCRNAQELMRSPIVARVIELFLAKLEKRSSSLLKVAAAARSSQEANRQGTAERIAEALRLLVDTPCDTIAELVPGLADMMADRFLLAEFVERLYDHWRSLERYLIFEASASSSRDRALAGHMPFIRANEQLKDAVLEAYRRIEANVRGYWPRVYRQVPAGANMSLLVEPIAWPCPDDECAILRDIRMVRLSLIEPPVVVHSYGDRRERLDREFVEASEHPLLGLDIDPNEWFCMPIKVGVLTIFVFFHQHYIALGTSLVNLFELAGHADARNKPDAMVVLGLPQDSPGMAGAGRVFYEQQTSGIILGAVARGRVAGDLGVLRDTILTIHNLTMLRRDRFPFHGTLIRLSLKSGPTATILLLGDRGAGRLETLAALAEAGEEELRELLVIAHDMGSLAIETAGGVRAYGSEIGAILRPDDVLPGHIASQMDRAIMMDPHQANARFVLPITTLEEVTAGHKIDLLLYANNYDEVDDEHSVLSLFPTTEEALHTYRLGAMLSQGTTISTGLIRRHFANPFGTQFRRDLWQDLAQRVFEAARTGSVRLGQLRTRTGIARYSESGPRVAARALLDMIAATMQKSEAQT